MTIDMLEVFDLIGTVAFAVLGAQAGVERRMDLFGVLLLAVMTAVGGGIVRDVVVANTPPMAFRNPLYVAVSLASAIVAIIARRSLSRFSTTILVCDAIGLGAFAATGADMAADLGHNNLLTVSFLAVVTAVGGGVLRDLCIRRVPGVLYKEIYATAALAGAAAYYLAYPHLGSNASLYICFIVTTVLRLLALRYRWTLPTAK